MITELIAVVGLVAVLGLYWYLFRGFGTNVNPIWGNILSSLVCVILCILFAFWFATGNIASPTVIPTTYQTVDYQDMSPDLFNKVSTNTTSFQYNLGPTGTGMYTISTIDSGAGFTPYLQNISTSYYYKYSIVYTQVQDISLAFLFLFLAIVAAILFVWFCYGALQTRENDREQRNMSELGE